MDNNIFLEEKNKLSEIKEKYAEVIEDTKLQYDNVYRLFNKEEAPIQRNKLSNRLILLEKNILTPYFARIDFYNNEEKYKDICYIGKVGISDFDNNIITVDWRSPIASLYYDSNIGNASFVMDKTKVNGELSLKRQYTIEKGELISYVDVDTVSNDELLKPYLSTSMDKRLKNIVSTIQTEQNNIIRSSIHNNLIVQGVAGSGKTTVALHRIAYLAYSNRKYIDPSSYMVIGPNKFFINYISNILPDLDVNDVPEYDLNEFTNKYLRQEIKLSNEEPNNKYICSLDFKNDIDKYFELKKEELINKLEIKVEDFVAINNSEIKNIIKNIDLNKFKSLNDLKEKIFILLNKHSESHMDNILIKLNNYIESLLDDKNLNLLREKQDKIRNKIKNNMQSIIRNNLSIFNLNTAKIYKTFNNVKLFSIVDLAPLLYINYKIYGNSEYLKYKHVVIDEAQDYDEFLFYTLKTIMKNASFSIYGDLAQSLYPNRSIENWDVLKDKIFKDINIINLNKSYRTSIEIMNEANKINKFLKLPEAIPVIRHSENVLYEKINNKYDQILKHINNEKSKYNTIGIIAKDQKEAIEIYENLKNKIDIDLIDTNKMSFEKNICIIDGKLSKGLEFDCVIISDADNKKYDTNNIVDMKMLYVSMTRALHKLIVLYDEKMNDILNNKFVCK